MGRPIIPGTFPGMLAKEGVLQEVVSYEDSQKGPF